MYKYIIFTALATFLCLTTQADDTPKFGVLPGEVLTTIMTSRELKDVRDWGHTALNIEKAQEITKGKNAKVAVLDTGWAKNHRDLKSQVIAERSFVAGETVDDLVSGHGTHCAGVIAAEDNNWGILGVAPDAKLLIGKVLSNQGSGSVVGIAEGIRWATSEGADVISMSLGGPSQDTFIPPAINFARQKGVIVVAAAGNDGPGNNTVGFPGGYPGVICVAATDRNNVVAVFSSRGERVDIAAPGVNIISSIPGPGDGLFARMSGTSMATPYIAGLAALWVANNQDVPLLQRQDKFFEALKASCVDLPPTGKDNATGWGIPDASKLITRKSPSPTPPSPKPDKKFILTLNDLSEVKRKELKDMGVTSLNLEVSLKQ